MLQIYDKKGDLSDRFQAVVGQKSNHMNGKKDQKWELIENWSCQVELPHKAVAKVSKIGKL